MSTSEPRVPAPRELTLGSLVDVSQPADVGRLMSAAASFADVADIDALQRLANEFFHDAGTATSAQAVPLAPSVARLAPGIAGLPVPSVADTSRAVDAAAAAFPSFYFIGDRQPSPSGQATRVERALSLPTPDLALTRDFYDVASLRRDFPILDEVVNGRPLVWLDNAATTQKPQAVIDRLAYFYAHENSNVHRAAHALAARSTDAYEAAREQTRRLLNAESTSEIVFVRGTTEAINLVAQSWGRQHIHAGDEIVLTWLEHHSNIVPWQLLAAQTQARIRVVPIDDSGQIRLDDYARLLGPRTRLVAMTHVSNALGTVTPVEEMVHLAHRHGARVLVDGAQAVSHMPVDVQSLDCDFYVFSGHKVFGPTGIGVLWGKADALEEAPPWQGGGNMIVDITFEKTVYDDPPGRFEAGTGSIADAVGLGAALAYLERAGLANVARHEQDLLAYGTEALRRVPGLRLLGTAREKAGVWSFVLDGFTTNEVGVALDREGIAVRTGHHCAQPALRRYGVESTVRPSVALYNSRQDMDELVEVLLRIVRRKGRGR